MSLSAVLAISLAVCLMVMTLAWLVAWQYQRIDIIDICWATLILGSATWVAYALEGVHTRSILIIALVFIWWLRLVVHLWRRISTNAEDRRYGELREFYGHQARTKYLTRVFLPQGFLAFAQSLPIAIALTADTSLSVLDLIGILVFVLALGGESVADEQLRSWKRKRDRAEKICREGLWRYSRHPNYFFEWCVWWSYVLMSLNHHFWYVSLAGPAIMYVLLIYLTGIPPIERNALKKSPEEFKRYQRETNVFFPGPTKGSVV